MITFLVTFPLLAIGSAAFRYFATGAYRRVREKIANVTAYLQETLSGVRIVRAFGQERHHERRFAELNEEHRAANMTTVYLNASYFPGVELLSSIGTAVILLYGGYQAIDGNVTIGVLVAFVGYLQSFFDPIQQLSNLYATYQQGMAAIDKIFDLLDTEPDMVDAPGATELPAIRGDVRFEGVWFTYDRDPDADDVTWALEDVTLEAPAGETLALVGATGAGKSTVAKLVARFYDPQRGSVSVDGHDLREVTQASLRRQLGIVPQEGFLFGGTVRENIEFGRPGASELEIVAATKAVGAHDFIRRLPEGYETEVGERGVTAVGRAAAADRAGAGADRRPADTGAGRGDRERRRARRGRDRAGPADAAGGAHRDRDRAPAVDGHERGPDRGAGARARGRDGHARRADRGRRDRTRGSTRPGPRQAAA